MKFKIDWSKGLLKAVGSAALVYAAVAPPGKGKSAALAGGMLATTMGVYLSNPVSTGHVLDLLAGSALRAATAGPVTLGSVAAAATGEMQRQLAEAPPAVAPAAPEEVAR